MVTCQTRDEVTVATLPWWASCFFLKVNRDCVKIKYSGLRNHLVLRRRRRRRRGTTEDEMVGWHPQLDGHESE